jgi:aerobic carbon-monoxide dehydrogenase medium subunit
MKAPDFDYMRPTTLEAAIALLEKHDGDALPLAGGQSLMPMMNYRVVAPEMLIDLAGIDALRGITVKDGIARIGAMTTYRALSDMPDLAKTLPLFAMALPHIAHDAIRNRGTIGGSLALADPAAEMPALMLALEARICVQGGKGERKIDAADFFLGFYETALEPGELITAIEVPLARPGEWFGFHELTQRHGDYAMAGVAIAAKSRAPLTFARVAFFGVSNRAIRVHELEAALEGFSKGDALPLSHLDKIEFEADLKASVEMKKHLCGVALTRALKEI